MPVEFYTQPCPKTLARLRIGELAWYFWDPEGRKGFTTDPDAYEDALDAVMALLETGGTHQDLRDLLLERMRTGQELTETPEIRAYAERAAAEMAETYRYYCGSQPGP